MNGQFLMNKAITVQYAFKKDGKGERHGTSAERLLAAQARKNNALPVAARPPPAPMGAFAAPMQPYQGPFQGQFAGALAAPPPPPGFTQQQTFIPQPHQPMPPPQGMPMSVPPPQMPVYNGYAPPPPPPGYAPQGMPGMPGMHGMPGMGMMPPPMMGPPGGMPPPGGMHPPPQPYMAQQM